MEKILLRETTMNPSFKKPEISDKLVNEKDGIWSVPLWNLNEMNLNGRTYNTALAERLVAENARTLCNDGHEDYCSEYANARAYAFDPFIEGSQLCVHFKFIDAEYEKKILFCLENGIPVGVSSVGYGTMDGNGVVNPVDYELVRYFDFVNQPANSTFVAKESLEVQHEEPTTVDDSEATAKANRRRLLALQMKYNERS